MVELDVTVVTPTVPGREALRAEARASVAAQVWPARQHLVVLDEYRYGPAWARNLGAELAVGAWLAWLDDDDVWYRDHLATLWGLHLDYPSAHVLYTRGRIDHPDRPGWDPQRFPFPAARMRRVNSLPCTGLVRADVFAEVGGFPDPGPRGYEDWGLWLRLLDAGCHFVGADVTTWEYRRTAATSRSRGTL